MDAFYASVEERENPRLRGKPLVVGGRADARGVVAAANYAAREFGIHSAMPTARALRRCAGLIVLKPRGELYAAVSAQIHEIFYRYTPLIEPLSLDEAFLDVRGSERLHGSAVEIGAAIQRAIREELQLGASVGVAPNKFLAKLASGYEKPNGFTVLQAEEAQGFLDGLAVERISGVGKAGKARLHRLGVRTVLQLRRCDVAVLRAEFGKHGEELWRRAHGVDERAVVPSREAKSISQETTFAADVRELEVLRATALALTEEVGYRVRQAGFYARGVQLKIRFDDFATITRARALGLGRASHATATLWKVLRELLEKELAGRAFAVRLLGVGATNLVREGEAGLRDGGQVDLLEEEAGGDGKEEALDALSDRIRARYGKRKIGRGRALGA